MMFDYWSFQIGGLARLALDKARAMARLLGENTLESIKDGRHGFTRGGKKPEIFLVCGITLKMANNAGR